MQYKAANSEKIKVTNKKFKTDKYVSKSTVQRFKLEVRNGPFFICVICNRCLYKRSVKIFHSHNYNMPAIDIFYVAHIKSFNEEFICLTCNKKLNKREVPCQAVYNKLEILTSLHIYQNYGVLRKLSLQSGCYLRKLLLCPKVISKTKRCYL